MEKELHDMPKALRLLAEDIPHQGFERAMCLRDAAALLESVTMQRDAARREAEGFRDDMRIHLTEGPGTFSWENARAMPRPEDGSNQPED
jgi:hypothetical protein